MIYSFSLKRFSFFAKLHKSYSHPYFFVVDIYINIYINITYVCHMLDLILRNVHPKLNRQPIMMNACFNFNGNVVDLSRSYLFEATGDSSDVESSVLHQDSAVVEDDDAQSCSGRSVIGEVHDEDCRSDDCPHQELINPISSCFRYEEKGYNNYNNWDEDNNDEDEDENEDEVEVNQRSVLSIKIGHKILPLGVRGAKRTKKTKVCNLEMISEKERDRLFWEDCLLS
ncbi:unnamed protein product [Cuscuta europaea]|uniref:Uncharacterized protein n=1 Tax=Cuscuta europaea TaxID=41803 RepID=A0A9P0ZVL9_CUSEU|nr:unnamed protein product [Cuscuta europaea]